MCEELRKQPDALERAAELDAQYGNAPDLAAMPMYCIPFSFKDSFDTKDMRTTGGGDARYDIDLPARDFTLVEQLRSKGAIIYAKSVPDEYNARAGNPGGPHRADDGDARQPRAISAAPGAARPPTPTTRARRRDRIELGLGGVGHARTSRCAASARKPTRRAAGRPTTTRRR